MILPAQAMAIDYAGYNIVRIGGEAGPSINDKGEVVYSDWEWGNRYISLWSGGIITKIPGSISSNLAT